MLKSKKRILELSIVLGCALCVSFGNFAFKIITANILDVESYGYFISLLATITLLSTLVGAGLSDYWLEIFSKLKEEANACIKSSFIYLTITYILALFITIIYMSALTYPISIKYIVCIVIPSIISGTIIALVVSLLRVERKHLKSSIILSIPIIINVMVFIPDFFANQKLTLDLVIVKYFFTNSLILIISLYLLFKKINCIYVKNCNAWTLSKVFNGSFYYGLSAFFYMIYYQGDILIINYYENGKEVAFYSVGFTLVSVSFILASVTCQRYFLPELHSSYSTDKIVYFIFLKKVIPSIALISVLVYIGYVFLAEEMICFFYDESYLLSERYIVALSIIIPIKYMSLGLGAAITASGNIKKKTQIMLVLSLVNIGLNIVFVPIYGAISAAYTTVICELILMLVFMYQVKQVIK